VKGISAHIRFVVVLDPNSNTSEEEALRTMRHEACHVATWGVMDINDLRGPPFQECMRRFEDDLLRGHVALPYGGSCDGPLNGNSEYIGRFGGGSTLNLGLSS
jgi:hypothetical protein